MSRERYLLVRTGKKGEKMTKHAFGMFVLCPVCLKESEFHPKELQSDMVCPLCGAKYDTVEDPDVIMDRFEKKQNEHPST